MELTIFNTAEIFFRFAHVIAGIMWIGNSLLFTWMEINLLRKSDPKSMGYLDMLHGGGVFHLDKRVLEPDSIPSPLHVFRWQSYSTWITGFCLLVIVFYTSAETILLDPSKTDLQGRHAVLISLGSLAISWVLYDQFWRSPIKKMPLIAGVITFTGVFLYAAWLDGIFNGRAVYLQVGAMLGTWMSANVFFHIIPNQNKMMKALKEGKPHNIELGKQAKFRSLTNHYLTFPVIFLMLSAHAPVTYGAERNVLIMIAIVLTLIFIKHMMNLYMSYKGWLAASFLSLGLCIFAVHLMLVIPLPQTEAVEGEVAVVIPQAAIEGEKVYTARGCQVCHLQANTSIAPTLHGLYGKTVELADGSEVVADEAYLRESILQAQATVVAGYAPAMPSYESILSQEEVDQLVAYIISLAD